MQNLLESMKSVIVLDENERVSFTLESIHDHTAPDEILSYALHTRYGAFNDYGYEFAIKAMDAIDIAINEATKDEDGNIRTEDLVDKVTETADQDVDIYTSDLLKWLASSIDNTSYVQEVLDSTDVRDFMKVLACAQYYARNEMYQQVLYGMTSLLAGDNA